MTESSPWRTVILTASTTIAHGPDGDKGGDELARWIEPLGGQVVGREVLTDSRSIIADRMRHWCDQVGCDLLLTSGGTGLGPRDLTPEATHDVAEREVPGIAEALRSESARYTGNWMLSRGTAATRGSTLIVNFPGRPSSIAEIAPAIEGALPHAMALIADRPSGH